MKKRVIFIILLMIPITVGAFDWEQIGPPGGLVTSIRMDPYDPLILSAQTASGISYQSIDGGKTSQLANHFSIHSPLDPDLLLTGTHRSTDGGLKWTQMDSNVNDINFNITNPDIIYAIDANNNKKLLVSFDKGLHWQILKAFATPLLDLQVTGQENLLFLSDRTTLYKSINGGVDWNSVLTPLSGGENKYVVAKHDSQVYVVDYGRLYRSPDFGKSWQIDSTQTVLQNSYVNAMAIDPANKNILYLAMNNGDLLKTINGGETWETKNNGLPADRHRSFSCLTIDPDDPQTVFAGNYGFGVYKTSDGGNNWGKINLPLAQVRSMCIDQGNPDVIYACTDAALMKSANGGSTWQILYPRHCYRIVFKPQNSNVAFLTTHSSLYKSIDFGKTWNWIEHTFADGAAALEIAIHPQNPNLMYVGQHGTFPGPGDPQKSTDGGTTWKSLYMYKNIPQPVYKITCDPTNPDIVYFGAGWMGAYKSVDQGTTWSAINNGLLPFVPGYSDIDYIFSLAIDPANPQTLYADNGGVVRTINGGESWTRIDSTLFTMDENLEVTAINYFNDKLFVSATVNDSVGHLYISEDEGRSWIRTGNFQKFDVLEYEIPGNVVCNPQNPDEIYIATMAGIYKTNMGQTGIIETKTAPRSHLLLRNYPNPFNPSTTITFHVQEYTFVELTIFDILGKEVTTLVRENKQPGSYRVIWNGKNRNGGDSASGIYFAELRTNQDVQTIKLVRVH